MNAWAQLPFYLIFYEIQNPSPWHGDAHNLGGVGGLLTSTNLIWKIPHTHVQKVISLLTLNPAEQ